MPEGVILFGELEYRSKFMTFTRKSLTMKTFHILLPFAIILFVWTACTPSDGVPVLKTKDLRGTHWQKNRVELFDSNQVLIRVIEPEEYEKNEILLFGDDDKLYKQTAFPTSSEIHLNCGKWEIEDGKLNLALALYQLVPDFCEWTNFSHPIILNQVAISMEGESLLIEARGIDINRFYLTQEEEAKIKAKIITARSYYEVSSEELIVSEEPSCCLGVD